MTIDDFLTILFVVFCLLVLLFAVLYNGAQYRKSARGYQ